jgi:SpoVK/Ycf46/Vps4 family AAA+-type ATPase
MKRPNDIAETVEQNGRWHSLDHLLAELNRIKLVILSGAKRAGLNNNHTESDHYSGYHSPLPDTESILSAAFGHTDDTPDIETISCSLRKLESDIALKTLESEHSGINLRLCELQKLFHLSSFEIDVILMCLLPELDSRFERYYAYLQDDITRRTPTVNLILKLLCADFEDTLKARKTFYPDAPLIKNNLIHVYNIPGNNQSALAAKSVQIDERIVDYLTGIDNIDARLRPFANLSSPSVTLKDLLLARDLKERLILFAARNSVPAPVYHLYGVTGTGKQTTAEAVCDESKIPLLHVDVASLLTEDLPLEHLLALIFREGKLRNSAIFFDRLDPLFSSEYSDARKTGRNTLWRELEDYPHLTFLSSEKRLELGHFLTRKLLVTIEFTLPHYSTRKQLWRRQFKEGMPLADAVDFDALANKFRLTAGQIAEAASMSRSLALWRDPERGLITSNDLYLACRQQSRQRLTTLTHQVSSRYGWDDIILPRDQKEQLIEICNQFKYRRTVYNDWGFGQKLARGKGLNILFSGPSGTGKTMASEIMGNELGIDVYKIDLSTIVSKYIGETEKNLDGVFREGTTANAIIFFDEADAIFGKRSEVRDAHDRYANIEISYLLQKIDDYDGVIILATNLRKNMDEAFTRRMHFCVEFPLPEEADRYRIWQRIFPEKAPLAKDIDLAFLARQFTITGGNIRNIAVTSAFLAAQDGGFITMESIIRATKREYQKIGKLCTESDFGQYFDIIKGNDF